MRKIFAVMLILLSLLVGIAFADILDKIADQQQRISQGVKSGELTRAEADILQDNLNWIRAEFRRMKADGRLNQREIDRLEQMLDRNSQMIFNKKHNRIERVYKAEIPERIANMQHRINDGIASGELTKGEADILQDNLNWIRAEFRRMKADGRLNQRELSRLDQMLDRIGSMIFNKKHNRIERVYKAEIPERIANMQYRINDGIASGELTRGEADVLMDNLNWIRAEFRRMKADGRLNQRELVRLDQMLDRIGAMIFNKKHNRIERAYKAEIPERIANMQARIDEGIASGELTKAEVNTLQDNLNWIKTRYAQMKADGRLNQKELSRLDQMLDRISAMIFNKKHNRIERVY